MCTRCWELGCEMVWYKVEGLGTRWKDSVQVGRIGCKVKGLGTSWKDWVQGDRNWVQGGYIGYKVEKLGVKSIGWWKHRVSKMNIMQFIIWWRYLFCRSPSTSSSSSNTYFFFLLFLLILSHLLLWLLLLLLFLIIFLLRLLLISLPSNLLFLLSLLLCLFLCLHFHLSAQVVFLYKTCCFCPSCWSFIFYVIVLCSYKQVLTYVPSKFLTLTLSSRNSFIIFVFYFCSSPSLSYLSTLIFFYDLWTFVRLNG